MPRLARLDAPEVLHHVMGRGIEGSEIIEEYPAAPTTGFPLCSNKLCRESSSVRNFVLFLMLSLFYKQGQVCL